MNRQYPCLEISRSRLRHNMEEVISRCTARGIQVCGVIKGCSGLPEVGRMFRDCGATQLASSPPGADRPLPPGRGAGAVYAAADPHGKRAGGRGPVVRLFSGERAGHAGRPGGGLRPAGSCPQGRGHGGPGGPAGGLLGPGRDAGRVRPCGAGPAPCGAGRRRREPGVLRLHPAHTGESGPAGTYRPAGGGHHRPEAGDRLRRGHQLLHPGPLGHHAGGHQPPAHRRGYLSGQGFTGGLGHSRHGLSADGLHDPAGPDRGGEGQAHPPVGPIMVDCFCNRPTYEDRGIRRRAIGRASAGPTWGIS